MWRTEIAKSTCAVYKGWNTISLHNLQSCLLSHSTNLSNLMILDLFIVFYSIYTFHTLSQIEYQETI